MLKAGSRWAQCPRAKSFTGGKKCLISKMGGKVLKLAKQIYSFDFPVVYENICCQQEVNFRTYDNLASYEPGNMEYRGRAYSTEVGACLCPVAQCKLEYE